MRPEKLDILRLGARDKHFVKLNMAVSARLLNTARKQKLPVPNGIILLDSAWGRLQNDGIIEKSGTDVTVHSADEFLERFALTNLDHTLKIEPFFETASSIAVDPSDHQTLIESLIKMWQATPTNQRCDILVSEAVNTKTEGKARTISAESTDKITIDDQEINLPRLTRFQSPTPESPQHQRIQQLLRGVRRSLNREGTDWQIRWEDDGEICWLTRVTSAIISPL